MTKNLTKFLPIVSLAACLPIVSLTSCSQEPYKNRIGIECDLLDHLKVTLTKVEEKDSIQIKASKEDTELSTLEKNGCHYICCYFDFKHDNGTSDGYSLFEKENFKLKDHSGSYINPLENIALAKSVEDYSWIGTTISTSERKPVTVAFEVSTKYSSATMDLYVEVDLSYGAGDGIDILLKE